MSDMTNEELIEQGLKCLDEALCNFTEVYDDAHIAALAKITHGAIIMGEMAYNFYRK